MGNDIGNMLFSCQLVPTTHVSESKPTIFHSGGQVHVGQVSMGFKKLKLMPPDLKACMDKGNKMKTFEHCSVVLSHASPVFDAMPGSSKMKEASKGVVKFPQFALEQFELFCTFCEPLEDTPPKVTEDIVVTDPKNMNPNVAPTTLTQKLRRKPGLDSNHSPFGVHSHVLRTAPQKGAAPTSLIDTVRRN